jgi:hypothetical protein
VREPRCTVIPFAARKPVTSTQPRAPNPLEGMMELLIGFVTTLFISLLIFRK